MGLVLLAAGVAAAAVASRDGGDGGAVAAAARPTVSATTTRVQPKPAGRRAAPVTTAAAARKPATTAPTKPKARPQARPHRDPLAVGRLAAEHSVEVLAVVGPRIFWIGTSRANRRLVHLQGRGTRWSIRPGQRLTFTAVVAANRRGAAEAWGLTRREGRDQLDRQGTHFEVYGPRIRFLCVRPCA